MFFMISITKGIMFVAVYVCKYGQVYNNAINGQCTGKF